MSDLLDLSEEQRFRLLISSVTDYAIYMLDSEGRVATWNPGAERFKGYSADEIIGQHFSRFFTPEDVAAGLCYALDAPPHVNVSHLELTPTMQAYGGMVFPTKDGA